MNTAVKFVSNQDGGRQNGRGNLPNSYTVTVDGVEVGQVNKSELSYVWAFYRQPVAAIDVESDYERRPTEVASRLPDLKAKVQAFFAA